MKIVFDALEPESRAVFEQKLAGHELVFLDKIDRETLASVSDAEVLSVFVSSPLPKELLSVMPSLKCVAARSMGFDHIDTAFAKERGIAVATVPTYGVRTVAEFAFALILGLSRKAYAAYDRLKRDGTTDVKDFEGFDLAGKTLGVVGTGNIGKNMVRIAKGFAMNVHMFDVRADEAFAKEVHCEYCPLDELVSNSDVISIHVPYMPATHHLVNADLLAKFKPGSILINTSRGGVVDTMALARALKEGKLGGAGLDVIEGERELLDETSLLSDEHHDIKEFQEIISAHALLGMDNVIITPHIAFNTKEAKREIDEVTCENILSFIKGTPTHLVQ